MIGDRRNNAVGTAFSIVLMCLVVCSIAATPAFGENGQRKFSYGITGSASKSETENPSHYFRHPEVQALLTHMSAQPITVEEVANRMSAVDDVTAEDLFRTRLLRKEDEQAFINFAFNTEEDILIIRSAIEEPLQALTQSYFEQSEQISEILDAYPAKTVSKGKLAFIILGAFSLDWDGLDLTSKNGYRANPPEERGHFFRADEQSDKINMKEIYKGSHNHPAGPFQFSAPFDSTFTTFGDHYRRGRAGFPDIFWQSADWYTEKDLRIVKALEPFSDEGGALDGFVSEETAVKIAEILYMLRKAPADFQMLRDGIRIDADRLFHILNLLQEIEYIEKLANGDYVLIVPVFDYEDQKIIDALLALSWEIMESWLAFHYDVIKAKLSNTTTIRHGVPYEEYFSNVWHHIFGMQNKEMVRAGFFENPYGIDKKYKAFYPALWRSDLYDFCSKEFLPCDK